MPNAQLRVQDLSEGVRILLILGPVLDRLQKAFTEMPLLLVAIALVTSSFLLLVKMPGATSSFLLLVVMPGATSGFLLLVASCYK